MRELLCRVILGNIGKPGSAPRNFDLPLFYQVALEDLAMLTLLKNFLPVVV